MVEKVVYSIMGANLIKDPAVQGSHEIMDLQELYDHLERFRLEVCTFQICKCQHASTCDSACLQTISPIACGDASDQEMNVTNPLEAMFEMSLARSFFLDCFCVSSMSCA